MEVESRQRLAVSALWETELEGSEFRGCMLKWLDEGWLEEIVQDKPF